MTKAVVLRDTKCPENDCGVGCEALFVTDENLVERHT